VFEAVESDFLEGYRIAVGVPPEAPVVWTICDECERLDPKTRASHIHEDMFMRAVTRYRAGQPTIIVDDEMLQQFEALALELNERNHRKQAECGEGWHRTSSAKIANT
jgi:hypothetical protein